MPIGCILGFIIAAGMISDNDGHPDSAMRKKFSLFLIVQNAVVTAATLPLIILARDKPISPPSKAASRKEEALNFRKELRLLLGNRSYLLLCVCFMSIDSICTAMGAIVASLTKPYHYSSVFNGICGGIFIIFGVIGSFILSIYLDRTPNFKRVILLTSLLAVVSTGVSIFTLPWNDTAFAVNVAVMGFSTIPMTPIAFSFAVELTYPTPESMSNGMMILPNKVYGALIGVISSFLCQ